MNDIFRSEVFSQGLSTGGPGPRFLNTGVVRNDPPACSLLPRRPSSTSSSGTGTCPCRAWITFPLNWRKRCVHQPVNGFSHYGNTRPDDIACDSKSDERVEPQPSRYCHRAYACEHSSRRPDIGHQVGRVGFKSYGNGVFSRPFAQEPSRDKEVYERCRDRNGQTRFPVVPGAWGVMDPPFTEAAAMAEGP